MRVERKIWSKEKLQGKLGRLQKRGFDRTLEQKQEEVYEKTVEEKLKEVDEAATHLKDQLSEENVHLYIEKVRSFVTHAVENAFKLLPQKRFDKKGRQKLMMICQVVDKKLDEMLQSFLEDHGPYLRILRLLDEIRGLLVDLIV